MSRISKPAFISILVVSLLTAGCVGPKVSSVLENNPELNTKLVRWHAEAPQEVRSEITILRNSGTIEKAYAAIRLGKMGQRAKAAIPALIDTLWYTIPLEWRDLSGRPTMGPDNEWNTSAAHEAQKALVQIGKPSVEPLIEILKTKKDGFCRGAAGALGDIGDKRAVEPLIATLKHKNSWVCRDAAVALGKIGDERAIEPLIVTLKEHKYSLARVHQNAQWALVKIGKPSVEPLIAALRDKDSYVRRGAAEALGDIGDKRAVEPLIAALNGRNYIVSMHAAGALGKIGDQRAVEPLIVALKHKKKLVRRCAAEALAKTTGVSFDLNYQKWKDWWEGQKTDNH